MLMTRFVYLCATAFLLAVNLAALFSVIHAEQPSPAIVPGTLILNAVAWPLALVVAYRVGQVTGVEYLRKARGKAGLRAGRGLQG